MRVKKAFLRLSSLLLAAASVLCLLYAYLGYGETRTAERFWAERAAASEESLSALEVDIRELKAREAAYTTNARPSLEDSDTQDTRRANDYEEREERLAGELERLLSDWALNDPAGEPLLKSLQEPLGPSFSCWMSDGEGRRVLMNGAPFLDLDKARRVVRAGRDYLADLNDLAAAEFRAREELLLLAAAVGALGLLSALLGLGARRIGALCFALLALCASGAALAFARLDGTDYPLCALAGAKALLFPQWPQLSFPVTLQGAAAGAALQFFFALILRWREEPKADNVKEPIEDKKEN